MKTAILFATIAILATAAMAGGDEPQPGIFRPVVRLQNGYVTPPFSCSLAAGFRTSCLDDRDHTVYVMPQIPDEDLKIAALLLGYQMNGSMVRYGDSIDLTAPVSSFIRTPTEPPKKRR